MSIINITPKDMPIIQSILNKELFKWTEHIPYFEFPEGYSIKPVINFSGSVIRFMVQNKNGLKASVYLDCYDHLGYVERFLLGDTKSLQNYIINQLSAPIFRNKVGK